ncbi:hypothetical protein B5S30_g3124 [[Candida] boidinii]|nr:hypothetical protein B5S30_g3124 [[Candida] boidinii]
MSAKSSPIKPTQSENEMHINSFKSDEKSNRHSLAPSRSILKQFGNENHTLAIMPFTQQEKSSKRRVSFAPEVTLHKIHFVSQKRKSSNSISSKRKRRETIHIVPTYSAGPDSNNTFANILGSSAKGALNRLVGNTIEDDNLKDDVSQPLSTFKIFEDHSQDVGNTSKHSNIQSVDDDNNTDTNMEISVTENPTMDLTAFHNSHGLSVLDNANELVSEEEEETRTMDFTNLQSINSQIEENKIQEINNIDKDDENDNQEITMDFTVPFNKIRNFDTDVQEGSSKAETLHSIDTDFNIRDTFDFIENNAGGEDNHETNNADDGESEMEMEETEIVRANKPMAVTDINSIGNMEDKEEIIEKKNESAIAQKSEQSDVSIKEKNETVSNDSNLTTEEMTMDVTTFKFFHTAEKETLNEVSANKITSVSEKTPEKQNVPENITISSSSVRQRTRTNSNGSPNSAINNSGATEEQKIDELPRLNNSEKVETMLHDIDEQIREAENMKNKHDEKEMSQIVENDSNHQSITSKIALLTPRRNRTLSPDIDMEDTSGVRQVAGDDTTTDYTQGTLSHLGNDSDVTSEFLTTTTTTTKISLADVSVLSNDDGDSSMDSINLSSSDSSYIAVSLSEFFKDANIKFLDYIDSSNLELKMGRPLKFSEEATIYDYSKAVQLLPNLEFALHSCNELKKDITNSREEFEELEKDILEDNPQIIREYYDSNEVVKSTLRDRFQFIKTYTRSEARNTWYTWNIQNSQSLKDKYEDNNKYLKSEMEKLDSISQKLHDERNELEAQKKLLKKKLNIVKNKAEKYNSIELEKVVEKKDKLLKRTHDTIKFFQQLQSIKDNTNKMNEEVKVKSIEEESLKETVESISKEVEKNKIISIEDCKDLREKFEHIQTFSGVKFIRFTSDSILKLSLFNNNVTLEMNLEDLSANEGGVIIESKENYIHESLLQIFTNDFINHLILDKIKSNYGDTNCNKLYLYISEFTKLWQKMEKINKNIVLLSLLFPTKVSVIDDITGRDKGFNFNIRIISAEFSANFNVKLTVDEILEDNENSNEIDKLSFTMSIKDKINKECLSEHTGDKDRMDIIKSKVRNLLDSKLGSSNIFKNLEF